MNQAANFFRVKLLSLLGLLLLGATTYAQNIYEDYVDGELFFKINNKSNIQLPDFDHAVDEAENYPYLSQLITKYGVTNIRLAAPTIKTEIFNRTYRLDFTNIKQVEKFIADFEQIAFIEYAEKVPLYRKFLTPNDASLGNQWYFSSTYIDAYNAWNLSTGNSNVVLAVIDDAVRLDHQDLTNKIFNNTAETLNGIDDDGNGYIDDVNGWDAADVDNDPTTPAGATNSAFTHGTHVAGIAAAQSNNSIGVASIGYDVTIMPIKCTENTNFGPTLDNTFDGIVYAVSCGYVDVANMSFGGAGSSTTVQNLITQGYNQGITWVAASGNSNVTTQFYPAAYNNVISVAATTTGDAKASFSNYGSWIDISAPGTSIYATLAGSTTSYGYQQGTSMASPVVAGLAALILSYNNSFTPAQIESCILSTADNIDAANPSYIGQLGAGRIDAHQAMICANPNVPPLAVFSANPTTLCTSAQVQYTDESLLNPTSWSWSFPGGNPTTSTQQFPLVAYNVGGTYDATLIATNAFGSDTVTYTNLINVISTGQPLPWSETWEDTATYNDWTTENGDNDVTWAITTVGGTTPGSNAVYMDFFDYNTTGERDGLISPPLDLSSATTAELSFEYAYRRFNASSTDSLIVYVSIDCGATFTRIWERGENGTGVFATQFTSNSEFTPSVVDDWCFGTTTSATCPTISLNAFVGNSQVVIKFESYNNYGNNLYLDNINVVSDIPPVVDFTASSVNIPVGSSINFTDLTTNSPTGWSWTFQGAATASSSVQNPMNIAYPTVGTYDVTLIATNLGGSDTLTKFLYINVYDTVAGVSGCDTIDNVNDSALITYIVTGQPGNFLSGHNTFEDMAKADYFANGPGFDVVTGIRVRFSTASAFTPTSTVVAAIWDDDGTGGAPGTVLATDTILINSIVTGGAFTDFVFSTPLSITGPFYAGIFLDYGPAGVVQDTLSIFTDTINPTATNTAWEQWSNGVWFEYSDASSWTVSLRHAIYPVVCNNAIPPAANFVARQTVLYEGNETDYIDLSSESPTSWNWTFSGGTPGSSTTQNPSDIYYNAQGSYNSELIVSNTSGLDTVVGTNYIDVLSVPTTDCDTFAKDLILFRSGYANYVFTGGGQLAGQNPNGDLAKAEKFFTYPNGGLLKRAGLLFSRADFNNASSTIRVSVWDASGAGGSPGAAPLAFEDVAIMDIAPDVDSGFITYVEFSNPPTISSDFFIGIEMTYGPNDTVGLFSNTIGDNFPFATSGWEQTSGGVWRDYDQGQYGGALLISHAIFPVWCPNELEANFEASDTTICVLDQIDFTDMSSSGATSWNWSFPGATPSTSTLRDPVNIQYNSPGTYDVTLIVSDGVNFDTLTRTNYISVSSLMSITLDVTDISCNNANDGLITVEVSGGTSPYTYVWNIAGTDSFQDNLSAGFYSVTVTDPNGCSDNGSATINNPDTITVSATITDLLCNGDGNGQIVVSESGGTLGYEYRLNAGAYQKNDTFNNLSGGTYTVEVRDTNLCTNSITVMVNEPTALSSTVTPTQPSCGLSNGAINISASGATPPYQYSIDNGATFSTTTSYTGLAPATYTVIVRDANNCTDTTSVTLNNPPPAVTIGSVTTVDESCASGGSITISASGGTGGLQYSIDYGATFQGSNSFTGLTGGTYNVVVEDAVGCADTTINVVINSASAPSITSITQSAPSCAFPNASITVNATGGTGTLDYSNNNGASFQASNVFSGLSAATYVVIVRDSLGCTDTMNFTVDVASALAIGSVNTVDVSCGNTNNGSLTINATGGHGTLSYSTDGGSTYQASNNFTGLTANTYNIVVRDSLGCTSATTATINLQPSPSISGISTNDVECIGNSGSATVSASGGTGSLTYNISGPLSMSNGTGVFNALNAGTYLATVTDSNSCTDTMSFVIDSVPVLSITNVSKTDATCGNNNGIISITVNGGAGTIEYSIDNGSSFQTGSTFSGLAGGSYTIIVRDATVCYDTSGITLSSLTGPTINTIVASDVMCSAASGSINIAASGGNGTLQYSIDNGTNFSTSNGYGSLSQGTYTVIVQDALGCTDTGTAMIDSFPLISIDTVIKTDPTCGSSNGTIFISASGGSGSLEFSIDGGSTYSPTQNFPSLASGTYNIVVRDTLGCTATSSISLSNSAALLIDSVVTVDPNCGLSDGSISIFASGGNGSLTYSIDGGSTYAASSVYTGLPSASYQVVVQDTTGCTFGTTVPLNDQDNLFITSKNLTDVTCSGASGAIQINISGGNGTYNYSIDGGTTTQSSSSFSGLSAGTYLTSVTDGFGCTDTMTAVIDSFPIVSITNVSKTDPACGVSNGTISITATGGSGNLSYSIDNGASFQASPNFSGLASGNYDIVVRDTIGCTDSTNITLTNSAALVIDSVNTTAATCDQLNDGALEVFASGGIPTLTYSIDSGATFVAGTVFTGLNSGNYYVVVMDNSGCTFQTVATVNRLGSPSISSIDVTDVACSPASGEIIINASGGTGSHTYGTNALFANQSGNQFSGLSTGNYDAYVSDSLGCADTVTYNVDSVPFLSITSLNTTDPACGQLNGSITVNTSGGGGTIEYSFDNGTTFQTSATLGNLGAGNYTVIVRDTAMCMDTIMTTLTDVAGPTISATSTNVVCNGLNNGTITASGSAGTPPYQYSNDGGTTYQTSPNFNGLMPGSYDVFVRDANGCTDDTTIVITEPTPILVTLDTTNEACNQSDGSVTSTVSGGMPGYTYIWSNFATTPDITGVTAGNYSVTVTDNSNCTVAASATVGSIAGPSIGANGIYETCDELNNGSATVQVSGGSAPITIAWSNGGTQSSIFGLDSGTYIVTVTDGRNCVESDTVEIGVDFSYTLVLGSDSATTLDTTSGAAFASATGGSGVFNFQWSNGGSTDTITGITPGVYSVTVTDGLNGCTVTDSITVGLIVISSIGDPVDLGSFNLYPNPSNGVYQLTFEQSNIEPRLRVFNTIGQEISIDIDQVSDTHYQFDLGNVANAVYLLEVTIGEQRQLIRLIKQ